MTSLFTTHIQTRDHVEAFSVVFFSAISTVHLTTLGLAHLTYCRITMSETDQQEIMSIALQIVTPTSYYC